jgi:intraflagellar transport protein 172
MLLQKSKPDTALELYKKYGAPAIPQNYNIYQKIALETLRLDSLESNSKYKQWSNLRDVLHNLTQNILKSQDKDSNEHKLFEKLLLIAHYNAMRSACSSNDQLLLIATKLSISLLRHCDIIPADKAFYEAGIMCQVSKNKPFVSLFYFKYVSCFIESKMG